jgi:hypothetical protein
MKCRGMFIARSLSYEGAEFNMQKLTLSDKFRTQYDTSARIFTDVLEALQAVPAGECSKKCKCEQCTAISNASTNFWGQQVRSCSCAL